MILITITMLLVSACSSVTTTQGPTSTLPAVTDDTGFVAEGRLEPIHYADIGFDVGGLVNDVLVLEGDPVTADQVIARLDNNQAETLPAAQAKALKDLTNAYEAVRQAQYKLDHFDIPSDIRSLTPVAGVEKTLVELEQARNDYEPYKYLTSANKNARQYKKRLDDAWEEYHAAVNRMELEANLQTAKADLAQRQNDFASLQDNANPEENIGTRAALANAELRAPFTGRITNLDLKVGEFAASGQPVVTIADLSGWIVKTTDLTEIDIVNVKEGQPVTVTLDAIPGVMLKGYVLSVAQNYSEKQGDIVYKVTVLLTDQNPAMRWGMTAEVKFEQ